MSSNYEAQMASMFGHKQQAQQEKWAARRKQRQERVSMTKAMITAASETMMQFASKNIDAQLNAAHRVAAQRDFDEASTREVTRVGSAGGKSIKETLSYSAKNESPSLDSEPEF